MILLRKPKQELNIRMNKTNTKDSIRTPIKIYVQIPVIHKLKPREEKANNANWTYKFHFPLIQVCY